MYLKPHIRQAISMWTSVAGGNIPHHVDTRKAWYGMDLVVRGYAYFVLPAESSPQLKAAVIHRTDGIFVVYFDRLEIHLDPVDDDTWSQYDSGITVVRLNGNELSEELQEELIMLMNRRLRVGHGHPTAWEENVPQPYKATGSLDPNLTLGQHFEEDYFDALDALDDLFDRLHKAEETEVTQS